MAEATVTRENDNSDSRLIVSNGLILISRRLLLWTFSGVLVLFLPRYLGDTGLGQLAFAQSVAGLFTTLLTLGLSEFLIKEIARNRSLIQTHLSAAVGIRIVMAFVAVGVIFAIGTFSNFSTDATQVLYIATATAMALSFVRLMASVMQGLEDMSWPAVSEVTGRIIILAIGIPVLVMGLGVVPYALVLFFGMLVNLGLNVAYISRRFHLGVSFAAPKIKYLIVGGAPFIFMGFLIDIYGHTDTIMLRMFTDEATVGWYAAANNIYKTIDLLPLALTGALLPTLSRVYASGANSTVGIAKKSISVGAVGIVPLAIGISLFANEIINTLPYPETFQNTVPLLTILALTIPVTAFLVILGTIAVAVDRQKAWVLALLVTVLLNIVFNIIAAPLSQEHWGNGGIGVALTTLGSEAFMLGVGIWLMPKGVIDRSMWISFLKVGISAGIMAGVVILVKYMGVGPAPAVVIGGATYSASALATGAVKIDDLRFIRNTVLSKINRRK